LRQRAPRCLSVEASVEAETTFQMKRAPRRPVIHRPRQPRGKGLLGVTLRYPYEVRKEDEYFDEIEDEKIPKDMMELASHIVETKSGHFNPEKFEDQYEDALKELLKKKQSGEKIEVPKQREPAKVISLMDALRRSVDAERGSGGRGKSERRAAAHRTPKKAARSSARKRAG
jgi:DNA end-binding protein Ku